MRRISIIGGGFCGTLTAVHLLRAATEPLHLTLIAPAQNRFRGTAYNPYSNEHLLNVPVQKMSAFSNEPSHFLDWVLQQPAFAAADRNTVAAAFLPRRLYGDYLQAIWQQTVANRQPQIHIRLLDAQVTQLQHGETIVLKTDDGNSLETDLAVLATGNAVPGHPKIPDTSFFQSGLYFQNPWQRAAVTGVPPAGPVLIIGNGLTMVDTVLGLRENGYHGRIISLSPNGYHMLPHRHAGFAYTGLVDELPPTADLRTLVSLFNKHRKRLQAQGVSAEPLIDSLRAHTAGIWQRLTTAERRSFLARLRHQWGVARHRLPLPAYNRLQELRAEGSLQVKAGRLLTLQVCGDAAEATYFDKVERSTKTLRVARVINCTGPETNLLKGAPGFLTQLLLNGTVKQDVLKLGLVADVETFQLVDANGERLPNLFTLGPHLRGELWESTAVNELRVQAQALAAQLLQRCASQPVRFSSTLVA